MNVHSKAASLVIIAIWIRCAKTRLVLMYAIVCLGFDVSINSIVPKLMNALPICIHAMKMRNVLIQSAHIHADAKMDMKAMAFNVNVCVFHCIFLNSDWEWELKLIRIIFIITNIEFNLNELIEIIFVICLFVWSFFFLSLLLFFLFRRLYYSIKRCVSKCVWMVAYALHQTHVLVVWVILVPLVNEIWTSVQRVCTHVNHPPIALICPAGIIASVNLAMKRIIMNVTILTNAIMARIAAIQRPHVSTSMDILNVFAIIQQTQVK